MADRPSSIQLRPSDGDPYDQLLAQVRQAAEGVYDVLGEMGRSKTGNVVYLAKELETGSLVAMKLSRAKAGQPEQDFTLEVVKTLDGAVAGLENKCPECKALLPDWDRFCFRCGADLSGVGHAPSQDEAAQLLEAVRQATVGEYDILGKMDRADGGGAVYFARDLKRDKLVALRLKQDPSGDPGQAAYSIGETQVFRPLAAELGATQVASAYQTPIPEPLPPPSPQPFVPPVSPVEPVRSRVAPPKRRPIKLIAGLAGVVLVTVIGYFAFRNPGADPAVPVPVPVPVPAPTGTPAPTPPPPPAPSPEPPAPISTAADDSASIVLGVAVPAGARLTVNGRAVRGGSVRMPAGAVQLALVVPGGAQPIRERVTLRPGQSYVWRPELSTGKPGPSVPPPSPPPAPAAPLTCARAAAKNEWTQAAELCRVAANAGDPVAELTLARMHDDGKGIPQDRVQAALWYEKAAAADQHEAQERLGYLYRDGLGVKRDEKKSAGFFRQAAEGGSVAGALEYGVALDDGKGVSGNDEEALKWFKKSSDGGNPTAARRLARLYERGEGTRKNEAEAARFYRMAADKGDGQAQYALGRLYKDGRGVEKSAQQALEWFRKAAAQGNKDAADEVRKLEKN